MGRSGSPGYIGWRNRFLGSLHVYKFGLRSATTLATRLVIIHKLMYKHAKKESPSYPLIFLGAALYRNLHLYLLANVNIFNEQIRRRAVQAVIQACLRDLNRLWKTEKK
jgi:hypothetical protein